MQAGGGAGGAAAVAAAAIAAACVGGSSWERANCEPAPAALAARGSGGGGIATAPEFGRSYILGVVPIFLATPFFVRATYRTELVRGALWSFEQKQGIGLGLNTSLNVRMTVGRLKSGGLFVYGPIAPTGECIELLRQVEGPGACAPATRSRTRRALGSLACRGRACC